MDRPARGIPAPIKVRGVLRSRADRHCSCSTLSELKPDMYHVTVDSQLPFFNDDRANFAAKCKSAKGAASASAISVHGVSQALYLWDVDQTGVELYWDRPADEWPRDPKNHAVLTRKKLELYELLASRQP
jgi:catechol-2,3-dioxygenase